MKKLFVKVGYDIKDLEDISMFSCIDKRIKENQRENERKERVTNYLKDMCKYGFSNQNYEDEYYHFLKCNFTESEIDY